MLSLLLFLLFTPTTYAMEQIKLSQSGYMQWQKTSNQIVRDLEIKSDDVALKSLKAMCQTAPTALLAQRAIQISSNSLLEQLEKRMSYGSNDPENELFTLFVDLNHLEPNSSSPTDKRTLLEHAWENTFFCKRLIPLMYLNRSRECSQEAMAALFAVYFHKMEERLAKKQHVPTIGEPHFNIAEYLSSFFFNG